LTLLKNNPETLLFLLLLNLSAGMLPAQPPSRMIDRFPELSRKEGESPGRLFTILINNSLVSSSEFVRDSGESYFHPHRKIRAGIEEIPAAAGCRCRVIRIRNESQDTLEVKNLIPLGASPGRPYITAYGPPGLARATLFRPGQGPVGLIVPDNAWELGFTTLDCPPDSGIALLARRNGWEQARRTRYSTLLFPGGEVRYRLYTEAYRGNWKEGWMHVFRDRWLYDLEEFDNHLYERPDLQWIRQDYLAVLQFAWDTDFYSRERASYAPFREFFHRFDALHGGYDIYGIWQGWPRLGLDPRNQWDLFRDLPGGTDSLRQIAQYCREHQSAFFISYNPWDESTRRVDHLEAIRDLILETGADGMVLDTRGSSSSALQEAADRAKKGVVMYSEGMAVPRDMPGIISGRVHNAILMSPPLNLNRLIKPEFQVFRVLDLRDGRIRREAAICLFNGYGMELNLFSPAHPWWLEEEYRFMGRCLMILRQNQKAFHDLNWIPLEEAADSIWANRWQDGDKIVYTLLSLKPEGHTGPLLYVQEGDLHWVSLWDHQEILPEETPQGPRLDCTVEPFSPAFTGTRSEGSVQCIAGFPRLLRWEMGTDSLLVEASAGDRILLWKGNPSYSNASRTERLLDGDGIIREPLSLWMHQPEGKIVIQLMDGTEILDERVIRTSMAIPVRITQAPRTASYGSCPEGMVAIKGGTYRFYRGNDADFIPYPNNFDTVTLVLRDYYMDRYPVTNREFREFLLATGYSPPDTSNFLKHWKGGSFPDSLADHPVVWVSLEDARAYAGWKGKRLPGEAEWQYAAQGRDGRAWPWGVDFDSTRCNNAAGHTTPVHRFPGGRSPFGVEDLTGNVWQMCDEEYSDGTYIFSMIRGGSWYLPASSWWYIQGGPQPNNRTQMLLRTSPGFDRSATVGFRCVCDK
jgi:gamma-glutamyl hercynylcysteine S-oxide synthase